MCYRPSTQALYVCLLLSLLTRISFAACTSCNESRLLCGPKCILAVCQKLEVSTSEEELVLLSGYQEESGTTMLGLMDAAKAKGLEAVGMKIGVDEFVTCKASAIAHLWDSHFVIVEASESVDTVKVTDPPKEPVSVKKDDFKKSYSGFALLIARDKSLFPQPEAKGPDLRADSYTWDFGAAEEGSWVEHTFLCSNVGVEELVISKLDSTCGCTAVSSSQDRIPPGGKAEIKVALDTTGRSGAQSQTVYIHSNDPITPVAQLQVSGAVWPSRLVYSPRSITFGEVRRGQDAAREIVLPSPKRARLR
ncbi:MAG: DUF1573 domain-containing protein [Armatimonadota bacterium]|nr:DUF1573 domain-containing protein [Armatimonadota bacterium]